MRIKTYEIGDTEEIIKLFYNTVHKVNIRDYTQEQVDAWAPVDIDIGAWMRGLSSKFTYVAAENEKIIGYGQLELNGHINHFYCHKDFQRKGVGTQILNCIESKARALGIDKLFTEASITARPFFESKGFIIVREQQVECRRQKFINFAMEKVI